MAFTRRMLLGGAGIAVVAAGGGLAWRAVDQGVFSAGTGPAYEPWRTWREDGEGDPLRLVRAAILAANPHNTQPWLFRLAGTSIEMYADTRRNIGAIDPYLREMYVGVGCALENLLIAAAHDGYAAELTLMPDPADPTYAARIRLSSSAPAPSALSSRAAATDDGRGHASPAEGESGPAAVHGLRGPALD